MSRQQIAPLRERDVTRHIAREFYREFDQLIESDVIIVGAGPSGLLCARDLASHGIRTLLLEQSLALGGGFWSGGYLMNKATICRPADAILEELGIPCKPVQECDGMTIVDPPHATARLIAAAYEAGAKIMNLTRVLDLIVREEGQLGGVVVNNTTAEMAGHDIIHVDPIALESQIVIDATGHDAVVVDLLHRRNLYKNVPGNGAMWIAKSEVLVVENTREVYPNCFVTGLAVAAVDGTPRMGPAFGSMILSGRKAAELVRKKLKGE
ncbi:MAG: sulfide-dependent adenosine diphosphate thiazole synthase [Nitrospirales bacterium]|nr:sulfide-dependent adenosine diphosphate thiazole synthase [Nitrospira sp.]MDR4501734.1 sulfide-dependent adenosine diphosphate thiazole synthase [Nitrospirales bacterium]